MSLQRRVKRVDGTDTTLAESPDLSFEDCLNIPNVVLLGNRGAGKTHLLTAARKKEDGVWHTASTFTIYADVSFAGQTVYIDALDEKRTRSGSDRGIDTVIRALVVNPPRRVRIACRALDWLGPTDLRLFEPFFRSNGGYCVASLQPLSEAEQIVMLESLIDGPADKFLEDARHHGVTLVHGSALSRILTQHTSLWRLNCLKSILNATSSSIPESHIESGIGTNKKQVFVNAVV